MIFSRLNYSIILLKLFARIEVLRFHLFFDTRLPNFLIIFHIYIISSFSINKTFKCSDLESFQADKSAHSLCLTVFRSELIIEVQDGTCA